MGGSLAHPMSRIRCAADRGPRLAGDARRRVRRGPGRERRPQSSPATARTSAAASRSPRTTGSPALTANGSPSSGACSLLGNDTDADGDPLTYQFVTLPAHGQVIKINEEGFAYQVEPDYSTIAGDQPGGDWVSDSFTYHACDATDCSAPATMRFWIAPVNDPPTFTGGPSLVEVDEDTGPYSGSWATNISPGPPSESAQSVNFEVSVDTMGLPDLFSVEPAISSSGVLTFTPGPDQYGLAKVTVRAKDDGGLEDYNVPGLLVKPDDTSDAVTFEIVVYPVDEPRQSRPRRGRRNAHRRRGRRADDGAGPRWGRRCRRRRTGDPVYERSVAWHGRRDGRRVGTDLRARPGLPRPGFVHLYGQRWVRHRHGDGQRHRRRQHAPA